MATTTAERTTQAPPDPAPSLSEGGSTRVHVGELISAGAAVVLAADLFAAKWYGVAGVPDPSAARPAVSTAENGWDALTIVRWVVIAAIVAALGSVLLHASQRGHGTKTDTSRLVCALGCVTSALLVYRVLINLPGPTMVIDQKLGAVVGVLLALAIAWGGFESIREQRARGGTPSRPRRGPLAADRQQR
ncbi:MAG: hypothetical protein WAK93_12010 [Solirubrobacteraceae bacterium]